MAPSLEAAGVTVDIDGSDDPVTARGSRLRLEQVLTNLMRNALDAMEDMAEPELRVALGEDDGCVWIEVADRGHGLGPGTLERLAEPFFTTRESGKGLGLGLAISSGILEDHGGRLDAGNRAEGGAVFRMILPQPERREMAAQ